MSSHKWGIYETPVDHHEFVDVFFKSAFVLYDFAVIAFERPNVCVCCTVSRKILRLRKLFSARFTLKSWNHKIENSWQTRLFQSDWNCTFLIDCLLIHSKTKLNSPVTQCIAMMCTFNECRSVKVLLQVEQQNGFAWPCLFILCFMRCACRERTCPHEVPSMDFSSQIHKQSSLVDRTTYNFKAFNFW